MPRAEGKEAETYIWTPNRSKVHVESLDRKGTLCGLSLTGTVKLLKTTVKVEEVTCQKCANKVRT